MGGGKLWYKIYVKIVQMYMWAAVETEKSVTGGMVGGYNSPESQWDLS